MRLVLRQQGVERFAVAAPRRLHERIVLDLGHEADHATGSFHDSRCLLLDEAASALLESNR